MLFIALLSLLLTNFAQASGNNVDLLIENNPKIMKDFEYVSRLDIKREVKIAVIGDYVHPEEFESIKANPEEIEGNGIDDDGNGYIDDIFGFDSDMRNGRLLTPVMTGHENGIVSIMDAIISNYNLSRFVSIIPINIYTSDGRFDEFRFKKLADSIDYAIARGAKIISISQGVSKFNRYSFRFIDGDANKSMAYIQSAIDRAKKSGAVVVGSVSNESGRDHVLDPSIPGNLENVLSVANVNFNGVIESGYGKNVDLAYYGTDIFVWEGRCGDYKHQSIWTCDRDGNNSGFKSVKGSSLSTPIVALSLGILSATGVDLEMSNRLKEDIRSSCSDSIVGKRNTISKCIYSPSKFSTKYKK
ncbi:S8 family serine peptidase [Halobacteriovorax marinus]|uniref:S8 family serine peptidase n=1 Tax=Halobacteriovorax marinus TaxID=97084 RepID=UPI003A936D95